MATPQTELGSQSQNQLNLPGEEEVNLQSRLAQIFSQFQAPQEPQQSTLQNVLSRIANAIVVATSKDPSAALNQQLQQRERKGNLLQQVQLQQQEARQQFMLQDLANTLSEQRKIKQEKRQEQYQVAKEQRDLESFREQKNIELFGAKELAGFNADLNLEMQQFIQDFQSQMAERSNEFAVGMAELNATNQKDASFFNFALPLLASGYGTEKEVTDLYNKISNGEKPTAAEFAKLGAISKRAEVSARKFDLRKVSLARAGGGVAGSSQKLADQLRNALISKAENDTNILVKDTSGAETVVPFIKDSFGQPVLGPGQSFVRFRTKEENITDALQSTSKVLNSLRNADGNVPAEQSPTAEIRGGERETKVKNIEGQLSRLTGLNKDQKLKVLDALAAESPADAEAINIVKTRLNQQNTEGQILPIERPKTIEQRRFEQTEAGLSKQKAKDTIDFLNKQIGIVGGAIELRRKRGEDYLDLQDRMYDLQRRLTDALRSQQ